jgi:hypothetical protein
MVKSKNTSELVVIKYYCRLLAHPTIIAQPVDYQYLRLAMIDIHSAIAGGSSYKTTVVIHILLLVCGLNR